MFGVRIGRAYIIRVSGCGFGEDFAGVMGWL